MINALDLVQTVTKAYQEGWGYIWGQAGDVWTQKKQNAATREQTIKYGQQWVGKRVADCSGLLAWAFKQLGGRIAHGSNTTWKDYLSAKGELSHGKRTDGQPLKAGSGVFKYNTVDGYYHEGCVDLDGAVIEAHTTKAGVIKSKITDGWTHWGEFKGVKYTADPAPVPVDPQRSMRRGDKGEDVKNLQILLNTAGFDCGAADGVFGANTEKAVKAFQKSSGLTATGVADQNTMKALKEYKPPKPAPDPAGTYITVQGDTLWKIAERFLGAGSRYKEIMKLNRLKNTIVKPGMVLKIPE